MDRDYQGECETCCGPIYRKSRLEVIRDRLSYDLWMALPMPIATSAPGYFILQYAGGHAYTCDCPNKVIA